MLGRTTGRVDRLPDGARRRLRHPLSCRAGCSYCDAGTVSLSPGLGGLTPRRTRLIRP